MELEINLHIYIWRLKPGLIPFNTKCFQHHTYDSYDAGVSTAKVFALKSRQLV